MGRVVATLTVVIFGLSAWAAGAQEPDAYFEVETLNAGLKEPPERVDRSTPRATLESLYRLAAIGDWDAAAHLLNLSEVPPSLQPETGPDLAAKLKSILERKIVIDWADLVDRPDAMDVSAGGRAADSGMARRSLRLWEFDLGEVPTSIRLNRVKPGTGEPVWVFSSRTVENIAPLYEAFGPSRFEEWLPDILRRDAFWSLMWWEIIGLPVMVVISVVVGLSVGRLVRAVRRRVSGRLASRIVRASSTPLIIAAITTVAWWGAKNVFVFSGRIDVFISPLVALGFVTAILMLILNALEEVLDALVGFDHVDLTTRQQAENREMATKVAALRRMLALVTFFIGVGIVFSKANVFEWLGLSILASAGALTLVLGFAARKVLGNIMSSLQISLNQSAQVGDRVVYDGHLCHVERINFTYVQLRDWDGTRLIVPVEEFTSNAFQNWTLKTPEMLRILKFKLAPTADLDKLRDALPQVIDTLDPDELDDKEKAEMVVTGQDAFGIDVWFYVPCADPNTSWDIACAAREELVRRMARIERATGNRIFPETPAVEAT